DEGVRYDDDPASGFRERPSLEAGADAARHGWVTQRRHLLFDASDAAVGVDRPLEDQLSSESRILQQRALVAHLYFFAMVVDDLRDLFARDAPFRFDVA